jgi:hypothetical protein
MLASEGVPLTFITLSSFPPTPFFYVYLLQSTTIPSIYAYNTLLHVVNSLFLLHYI